MPDTNATTPPENHDHTDHIQDDSPSKNQSLPSPSHETRHPGESIIPIPRADLINALQYLWVHQGKPSPQQAERFIEYADDDHLSLDLCWACRRSDSLLFPVVLALPNTGRTAMIFASHLTDRRYHPQLTRLLKYVAHDLDPHRIRIAQALLTPVERSACASFEEAGFFRLAELSYMEVKPSTRRPCDNPEVMPADTTMEQYSSQNEKDFKAVIIASYEDTLDCPGLCELRTIDDVLAGHKGVGAFDPKLWTLVRVNNQPAAVLLLSHFPNQSTIELTYLGVGASFRGKQLGRLLVNRTIAIAQEYDAQRITLAVDNQNAPAIQLYKNAGFRRIDRRTAMILSV